MSAERWQRLEQAFDEAAQQPPERRAAVVAQLCDGDETLRSEALSLLDASDQSGAFLSGTAFERLAGTLAADGWSLRPGERIGPYIVERLLGSGGSGEVWRARDVRLSRHVAIKVLLPHLSSDTDRLRRFLDEARTAGALNHSNVLSVYDIGEHHGAPFLVSECLEGQSLRKRLEAGPLPLDDAVAVALGIARGLAAAHARGIVHRDLKPDNVFVRSDGGVKILDFGLAKLRQPIAPVTSQADTMTGVIVGTAGYMAPEQVQGGEVDARADLFALGATMYEMIVGQRAFKGDSAIETLHTILTTEPPPLSGAQRAVPPAVSTIVTRLLKKSPDARFQSAGDLAWALEQVGLAPVDDAPRALKPGEARADGWRGAWLLALAAIAVAAAAAIGWSLRSRIATEPRATLAAFTWPLPSGLALDSAPVVSPDSQSIAFVGRNVRGSQLFVRKLGSLDAVGVPDTDDAHAPFWSPDSTALGFFARGKLMKVSLAGGVPSIVCEAPEAMGGAWSRLGTIVFQSEIIDTGLFRVSADGGPVEPATRLDAARGENAHRWPAFLADGVHFLYFVRSNEEARRGVYVGRIDRPAAQPEQPLFHAESEATYAPLSDSGGVLFSIAHGALEARRFDTARLALAGDVRTLAFRAGGLTPHNSSMMSASADVLTFASTPIPYGDLLGSVDRNGEHLQLGEAREVQGWPRVSPDGRRLVRQRLDATVGGAALWVDDLERGTTVRVTASLEMGVLPTWSPDSRHFVYTSGTFAKPHLSIAPADGTGARRQLPCPASLYCEPTDWSHDGRLLLMNVRSGRGNDVWTLETESGKSQPLLAERHSERDARLSPDGRWIAYVSNETGQPEVSVRSFTGPPHRTVISSGGGSQPVWRRDGGELFFVDRANRLHSVSVRRAADGSLAFGMPVALNVPTVAAGHWSTQYDVTPDGRRFYFIHASGDASPREITVVTAWRALFK